MSQLKQQPEPGAQAELETLRRALATEYDVLEELGRGGMAVVYLARDRQLDREVALKVLPPRLMLDAAFVERFQREGRIAAQLEHPHIVPIYRVGREGEVIYFAMKHLRGGSLAGLLQRQGQLSPGEVRRVLLEVGDALDCAGSRHIVHRDIKPENILFDEAGRCVVTDFGIAKTAAESHLTGTGQSIGTPHYMSPEQARGVGIDVRSDLYSLGVVAYHCLAGKVPFDGTDNMAILYAHVNKTLPTPALPTSDHVALYRIIQRLVAKNPADRIQSGRELVDLLEREPSAGSSATMPVSAMSLPVRTGPKLLQRARDLWSAAQRHPRAAAMAGGVVGLLLVAAYGGSAGSSQSLCPPAPQSGNPEFLLLMDPLPHQTTGSTFKIAYDVCGLPRGTPYNARIQLSRDGDFFKKVFGDKPKPLIVTFQDKVDGVATRRHRSVDLESVKPGTYSLEISVRDNRSRVRKRVQRLSVRGD